VLVLGFLAVTDIVEDKAKEFARRHNVQYYFKSLEDMLDNVELDVLSVIVPPQAHNPSIWEEPLPYVIMESMLLGTIPVASRVGGIPEIVEGTYADYLTFMPGGLEEIVGKIEKVLSLPQSRLINIGSELGEIIRRKFNNSALRQRLLKVFSG
jgi:hypothetical protein